MGGGGLGISYVGDSNGGDELRGDWVLHFKETEHGRAIYCNTIDSGSLLEDGVETGGLGCLVVVGTGAYQFSGYEGAGRGGRGGGEGRRRGGA